MSDLITDFTRQNEWANLRLIEACRDLTDAQLDSTAEGTFGTIRETWQHVISSELYYARRLGQEVETWDRDADPWPGWDALVEMAGRAADAMVVAAADGPSDRLVRSSSGEWDIEAAVIVIQSYHHGTDHRSQINTILTTLGLEAPDISSWSWAEDAGRIHKI